jgi:soluble lytic murein transglycosylase
MLSKFMRTAALAALTSSLGVLPATASAAQSVATKVALSRTDDAVLEMGQAFKRADKARLAALLPQTRGHVLEPWAAYWELRNRLDLASTAEVQAFLARYAGTYQEDRMRNDWLLVLGQRRDWAGFAAEHPLFRMGDDREVRCFAWFIEHQKNGAEGSTALVDQVRQTWYAQRDADEGCRTAAERLLAAKQLSSLDIWRKARLSIEANRPRPARDAVEMVSPESLGLLASLQANPEKFLTDKKIALTRVRKELITLALVKLAVSDPEAAARQIDKKWDFQLSAEERNWVWGVIGKQSAMRMGNQSPDALAHFHKVSADSDLTDDMLAWKTRAALRAGKQPRWSLVLASINAMSVEARKDSTWVYWKARALLALAPAQPAALMAAQRAEALALLQSIASVRGFYEQLALEELGQLITVPAAPAALTAEEKEAARSNAGLQRAAYAIAIGLRSEGVREWNYATNLAKPGGMNERELLAAAQLACDRAIWDRCINTSERTRGEMDFAQRFPMPFREAVLKRSSDIGIDPAYVYGLIRQESRFIMDARSGVGASGLMQIMPATARETARHIGLSGFTANQINDRDTNITIGTAYLKRALDDFGGSMAMAAAAYNAGPSRPRNWRNGPPLEAAIWAENVPFHETRDYVKKVLSNSTSYAALLTGKPQSLKARLGTVAPRDAAAPPIDDKMP